ncbi:WUSCHEL-related homeobox 9 [Cornus florida]|uniref:WUSCHEL-related homeobox 9 n=1 Tax=Cornus florida TaxID=4283 RepID=UPI0028A25D37|nr:WUSCHEL-related homeobox 9 [Cornus florida]
MASSNRHWPSMFKSKPCNTHQHQWQHDINPNSLLSSGSCHRAPYTSVPGCEERAPEPKPRWNPKPEQIRILEAIFNSGMVNPPRDEIRKIRAKLQEYGQVGDANVFYWFQNRKSRSKHKQRQLQNSKSQPQPTPPNTSVAATAPSSSSSSDKSSPKSTPDKSYPLDSANVMDLLNSPTPSVNQNCFQAAHGEFLPEVPFFYPAQPSTGRSNSTVFTQGFCFPEVIPNVVNVHDHQTVGTCSSLFLSELMMNHGPSKEAEDVKIMRLQQQLSYTVTTAPTSTSTQTIGPPSTTLTIPSTINHLQGVGYLGAVDPENAAKSTVFINDVAFEVGVGGFNVREAFGDDAVLIHSSGHPVLTNEWGVTLQSLQHGSFYYLLRTLTPSPLDNTNHLLSTTAYEAIGRPNWPLEQGLAHAAHQDQFSKHDLLGVRYSVSDVNGC